MATIILLSVILILISVFLHQAAFTFLTRTLLMNSRRGHPHLYLLMLGIFVVHLAVIILYALGYYMIENVLVLGFLQGDRVDGPLGYFYASAVFYTSLGLGDVLPNDHLRFVAVVEALNGLLLIAWSASFLFTAMGQFWHCLTGAGTGRHHVEKINGNEPVNEC